MAEYGHVPVCHYLKDALWNMRILGGRRTTQKSLCVMKGGTAVIFYKSEISCIIMGCDIKLILKDKTRIVQTGHTERTIFMKKRIFMMMKRGCKNREEEEKND